MNMAMDGKWMMDHPPVQEVIALPAFEFGALKLRKKSSALAEKEVKLSLEDVVPAAAAAFVPDDVQKVGGVFEGDVFE